MYAPVNAKAFLCVNAPKCFVCQNKNKTFSKTKGIKCYVHDSRVNQYKNYNRNYAVPKDKELSKKDKYIFKHKSDILMDDSLSKEDTLEDRGTIDRSTDPEFDKQLHLKVS